MNIALMEYVIFFTDFAVQFSHTFVKNGATLWIPSRACLVFSIPPTPRTHSDQYSCIFREPRAESGHNEVS